MHCIRLLNNIGISLAFSLLACCTYVSQGIPDEDRGALPIANDHFGDQATRIVYPEQNWDASDSL